MKNKFVAVAIQGDPVWGMKRVFGPFDSLELVDVWVDNNKHRYDSISISLLYEPTGYYESTGQWYDPAMREEHEENF